MKITIDASAILSVLTNEPHRDALLNATQQTDLIAPGSLPWEIGNALSVMFRRGRIGPADARQVLAGYEKVPIQLVNIALQEAVDVSRQFELYAYDAYMLVCARNHRAPLLTLDRGLSAAALAAGIDLVEI